MQSLSEPRPSQVFWGEIAPTEHLVQLYGDDTVFLDALEGFVAGGLLNSEAVIVIATAAHRRALHDRLSGRQDIDLELARSLDQFISVDAEEALHMFMVERDGQSWPNDERFEHLVGDLLNRARWGGPRPHHAAQPASCRKVRAFGEMVAVLWARGLPGATVRLEHLWNRVRAHSENGTGFPLFCAYPKTGFTQDARQSLQEICACHTQIVN